MACKRTDLGPGMTVWNCGRGQLQEAKPVCEVCRVHPAVMPCGFELRGAKAGQTCGKQICRRCAGDSVLCPPHARMARGR